MPPKIRISKDELTETAVRLVKENGESALNARSVAAALNCSTQPVFSNFSSMEELRAAVIEKAYEIYLGYLKNEAESEKYPKYKAFGMAYVRFAKEEKELFKLLFMRDRTDEEQTLGPDFNESVKMIMKANNVSREAARLIHFEMWACVHGLGTMVATSFMQLEPDEISNIISDVYKGVSERYSRKENKDERD